MSTTDTGGLARNKTLLDDFAGDIIKGMVAQPSFTLDIDGEVLGAKRAATAYALAEAMIAEKRRRESSSC